MTDHDVRMNQPGEPGSLWANVYDDPSGGSKTEEGRPPEPRPAEVEQAWSALVDAAKASRWGRPIRVRVYVQPLSDGKYRGSVASQSHPLVDVRGESLAAVLGELLAKVR